MLKRDELVTPESCLNRARDDEFIFVLLGRDPALPGTIRFWIGERLRLQKNVVNGDQQIQEATEAMERIEAEQKLGALCSSCSELRVRVSELMTDLETGDREWKMLAGELGCESTREEIFKEIRRLKDAEESAIEVEVNLADYAKRFYNLFEMYRGAWLREMGGVIVPKHWEIDGFVLRMKAIYEKAKLVDRIKVLMIEKLKAKWSAEEMFDSVFQMLAEDKHDKVPTN